MSEQALRDQLYASFKHRAMLYYLIFDELRKALDEPQAIAILQRAIRRRGEVVGQQYAAFAPDDLTGLCDAFLANIPDAGRMFAAKVDRCDADHLDITLQSCPLRDAWQEAGLERAGRGYDVPDCGGDRRGDIRGCRVRLFGRHLAAGR